jgi:SIR2-like domain
MVNQELPDELYEEIQNIFRMSPALLVGSGFSCGYELPSMWRLGEFLTLHLEGRLISQEAKELWNNSIEAIKENLENGLNTIPLGGKGREEIINALRQITAELIQEETNKAETKIRMAENKKSHAPVRLLKRLFEGTAQNVDFVPVITTNYDTLIELFCDLAELPIDTGFTGHRIRTVRTPHLFQTNYKRIWAVDRKQGSQAEHRPIKTIRLHKPHGSISWLSTNDGPIEALWHLSSGERAIVVPGPSKYQDAMVNVLFDSMRTEMNAVLQNAAALLCIGFGFNDEHLQGVIRQRLQMGMPLVLLTQKTTASIDKFIQEFPHLCVILMDGEGACVQWRGQQLKCEKPIWTLDEFLKIFLE